MDAFEVSGSTFKRDLTYLRDRLGAPIEYDNEKNGYALTEDAFEIPSFWFNRTQLILLVTACKQIQKIQNLHGSILGDFGDRLQDLLTLCDGSSITDCFSFEQVEWAFCDCRHLDLLMEAVLQKRCVSLTYHTAGTDTVSRRLVEPYRLHNYMGTWYLIGFCHHRQEARVFQIARILELTVTDDPFEVPRFDVPRYVDTPFGIFKGSDVFEVVLRFDPQMARFIRNEVWHHRQKVQDGPDGSLTLTLPVADVTEIKMKVLKYGSHVEVITPEALRREVAEEAKRIVDKYRTGVVDGAGER